jgi:hypothetical protein
VLTEKQIEQAISSGVAQGQVKTIKSTADLVFTAVKFDMTKVTHLADNVSGTIFDRW